MSQEKKGIAAWLELPEEARRKTMADLRCGKLTLTSHANIAADALEELSDPHKVWSALLAAELQSLVGQRNTATGLQRLVEKLGGREALQELLNFFGDWPQPWDEGDPGPARRAISLVKKYEEKFAALRQLVHGTPGRFFGHDAAKVEKIKELLEWPLPFGCGRPGCPNCGT